LAITGRQEEGIREAKRAVEIDPLSANAATCLGQVLYYTRRYDEATIALNRALEIDPNYPTAVIFRGLVHLARQQFTEAIALAKKAVSIYPHPTYVGIQAAFYALAGRREDAVRILNELTALATHSYVCPFTFVFLHAGMGDTAGWRKWVQAAFEERSGLIPSFFGAPLNDNMRSDPLYQEMCRKVGLPE
jgi:serine/threonine-protein kinase